MIKIPQFVTDHMMMVAGNRLSKETRNGRIVPKLTFNTNSQGHHVYWLEFVDTKDGKSILSIRGCEIDDGSGITLLEPLPSEGWIRAGKVVNFDGLLLTVKRLAELGIDEARFRVEMKPPCSSAVYLALEGQGKRGHEIIMGVAQTHPNG